VKPTPTSTYFLAAVALGILIQSSAIIIWDSWVNYTPPLNIKPPSTYIQGDRIVEHVIIVLVDGARPDLALLYGNESGFGTLYMDGVWFHSVYAYTPTYSTPARAAIATGLPHELTGVSSNEYDDGELSIPNIFSLAKEMGLTTAVVGDTSIKRLFNSSIDIYVKIPDEFGQQRRSMEVALDIIRDDPPNLMWIGLSDVDMAGHMYGAASEEYRRALQEASELIQLLIDTLYEEGIISDTLLIVLSDHGHLDIGGHGDDEEEVRRILMSLYGGPVLGRARIGDVGYPLYYTAVAPTVTAMLGLPGKIYSDQPPLIYGVRGYIMGQMMNYTYIVKENYRMILEELLTIYEQEITLEEYDATLSKLRMSVADGDVEAFIERLVEIQSIQYETYGYLTSKLYQPEMIWRVIGIMIPLTLSLAVVYLVRRRGLRASVINILIGLASTSLGLYYFTYVAGFRGTMSSVNNIAEYLNTIIISAAIAILASALLIMLYRRIGRVGGEDLIQIHLTMVLASLINTSTTLFSYGPLVRFPFPDWTMAYNFYTSMIYTGFILILGIIIPVSHYISTKVSKKL